MLLVQNMPFFGFCLLFMLGELFFLLCCSRIEMQISTTTIGRCWAGCLEFVVWGRLQFGCAKCSNKKPNQKENFKKAQML
jgi:hypothetical protein